VGTPPGWTAADEYGDVADLFELITTRPSWHRDAACKEAPLSVSWFAGSGNSADRAKAICGRCLVREDCLAWSLLQGTELDGIFGGMDRRERAKLRRERKAA
jgi:WhiB family redox-sensing transcriptional regulator